MPIGIDTLAYRRDLPHLAKRGKTYFITFRANRILSAAERDIALRCCLHDHQQTYLLACVVIMPDHAHMIVTPHDDWSLATIMHRVKSVSAHEISRASGKRGHVWQHESFDHILRSVESLKRKADYVAANPVRAGLVSAPEDYRWLWRG